VPNCAKFHPCWRYGANCEKLNPDLRLGDASGEAAGCGVDEGAREGTAALREAAAPLAGPRLVVELVVGEDAPGREEALPAGRGVAFAAPLDDEEELVRVVDALPVRLALPGGEAPAPPDGREADDDERAGAGAVASPMNSKKPMRSHLQRDANRFP
jgi:hypothetical protein